MKKHPVIGAEPLPGGEKLIYNAIPDMNGNQGIQGYPLITGTRPGGMMLNFREILERNDELRDLDEIDPYLEGSAPSKEMPSSPWIANVKGREDWRIAGNVYSDRSLLASALGCDLSGINDAMMKGMEEPIPFQVIDRPASYRRIEVEDLPIPTYFRGDGGPYVTSAIFHAGFGKNRNLSFHRMMHLGGNRFAVRVVPRHLKALLTAARKEGKDLPAVVSIGADPYSLLAGSTTLEFGKDELEVASALKKNATGEPLKVFSPDGGDLLSPSGTEIVMSGRFINENVPEGPFVDITSTYDHAGLDPGEPVFVVDKVLVREDPIFHFLLPGGYEHYLLMGLPKEPAIKRAVKMVVPKVHSVRLTEGGCCWLHGIVSITPQRHGDSKNAIMAAFSGHPSMKRVIVVNGDIDIFDDPSVEWALATRFQADRDMVVVSGARGSSLDPSSVGPGGTTTKLGLDATIPMGREKEFENVD